MESTTKIQTLHPQAGKTNKKIARDKYDTVKSELIAILKGGACTHTELMEALYRRIHPHFEGGIQWYGETVKLDLEAREIVERTHDKPQKYRLVK